jgi:hypothetical protein
MLSGKVFHEAAKRMVCDRIHGCNINSVPHNEKTQLILKEQENDDL